MKLKNLLYRLEDNVPFIVVEGDRIVIPCETKGKQSFGLLEKYLNYDVYKIDLKIKKDSGDVIVAIEVF